MADEKPARIGDISKPRDVVAAKTDYAERSLLLWGLCTARTGLGDLRLPSLRFVGKLKISRAETEDSAL